MLKFIATTIQFSSQNRVLRPTWLNEDLCQQYPEPGASGAYDPWSTISPIRRGGMESTGSIRLQSENAAGLSRIIRRMYQSRGADLMLWVLSARSKEICQWTKRSCKKGKKKKKVGVNNFGLYTHPDEK